MLTTDQIETAARAYLSDRGTDDPTQRDIDEASALVIEADVRLTIEKIVADAQAQAKA